MCVHGCVCLHNLNRHDIFSHLWLGSLSLCTLTSSLFISLSVTWHWSDLGLFGIWNGLCDASSLGLVRYIFVIQSFASRVTASLPILHVGMVFRDTRPIRQNRVVI